MIVTLEISWNYMIRCWPNCANWMPGLPSGSSSCLLEAPPEDPAFHCVTMVEKKKDSVIRCRKKKSWKEKVQHSNITAWPSVLLDRMLLDQHGLNMSKGPPAHRAQVSSAKGSASSCSRSAISWKKCRALPVRSWLSERKQKSTKMCLHASHLWFIQRKGSKICQHNFNQSWTNNLAMVSWAC